MYRVAVINPPKVVKADVNENVNTKQWISTSEYSLQFVIATGIGNLYRNFVVDPGIKAKQSFVGVQDPSVILNKKSFQVVTKMNMHTTTAHVPIMADTKGLDT